MAIARLCSRCTPRALIVLTSLPVQGLSCLRAGRREVRQGTRIRQRRIADWLAVRWRLVVGVRSTGRAVCDVRGTAKSPRRSWAWRGDRWADRQRRKRAKRRLSLDKRLRTEPRHLRLRLHPRCLRPRRLRSRRCLLVALESSSAHGRGDRQLREVRLELCNAIVDWVLDRNRARSDARPMHGRWLRWWRWRWWRWWRRCSRRKRGRCWRQEWPCCWTPGCRLRLLR